MRAQVGRIFVILCTCFLQILKAPDLVSADKPDLYSAADNVMRLNSSNFDNTVFNQTENVVYMVQFYNTFCGHCQMFAPIYKNLATRVQNWTSVVRIAGVDCSKDENVNTCSENKVMGYPTLFLYPPKPQRSVPEDEPLNLRSLNIQWTVDDIEETIIEYLGNLTKTSREIPSAIRALEPITSTDIRDFKRLYPSNVGLDDSTNENHYLQDLMFIIESESSYLGRKLIIEYYRINTKLELRRISTTNEQLLRSILSDTDYSSLSSDQPVLAKASQNLDETRKLKILVKGEASTILPTSSDSERDDYIHDRFRMFLENYYFVELRETGQAGHSLISQSKNKTNTISAIPQTDEAQIIEYLVRNDPVGSKSMFAIDLLKSISYMITHEIKIKGNLSPKDFNTVRNLLSILKKFLPLDKWDPEMAKFITELRTKLDDGRLKFDQDGVEAQEMKDILEISGSDEIRLKYNKKNWISCHNSDRNHKGYTCSLWLLFHSLTVGEYTRSAPVRAKPKLVLTTMRDYIINFLGCSVCATNFEKETENLESSLNHRNSSVLWLWNTHNMVNQRLNNEKGDDKRPLRDIIFPTSTRCPSCLLSLGSEIGIDGKTYTDIIWNMPQLFEFVMNLYKGDNIISPTKMHQLMGNIERKLRYELIEADQNQRLSSTDMNRSEEQWNIQSIFTTSDMSLCLFLYVCSLVMLGLVAVAISPKFKRKK